MEIEFNKIKDKLGNIFVSADLGEGKTAFSFYLCEELKKSGIEVYTFKHPKKELIKPFGYKNLNDIDEIENLNNVVIWIDEPQILLPKYEKRGSIVLNKLLSLTRQRDIILILSTSDTRYITMAEEFYISTFIIKRIDYTSIKKGSKLKNIITEVATLTPSGYANNIAKNEYLFYNRRETNLIGKYQFKMPDFFNEQLSKVFSPNLSLKTLPKQAMPKTDMFECECGKIYEDLDNLDNCIKSHENDLTKQEVK